MVLVLHVEEAVVTPAARSSFATPILLVVIESVEYAMVPALHVEEVVLTPAF